MVTGLLTHVTIDGAQMAVTSFEIRNEPLRVETCTPEIDPTWVYQDQQGHWHYIGYEWPERKQPVLYRTPTMEDRCARHDHSKPRHDYDDDECTFGWYCKKCGEVLHPSTRIPPPTIIQGPTSFHLTVQAMEWWKRFRPGVCVPGEEHILTLGAGSLPVHVTSVNTRTIRLEG